MDDLERKVAHLEFQFEKSEEKVVALEATIKKMQNENNTRLEMLEKNVHKMTAKERLSFETFKAFCLKHQSAGAFASAVTHKLWIASDGKNLFTKEDHDRQIAINRQRNHNHGGRGRSKRGSYKPY